MKDIFIKADSYGRIYVDDFMQRDGVHAGVRVVLVFKPKKRKKLRKVHVADLSSHYCDGCCNSYTDLRLMRGDREIFTDTHFRAGFVTFEDVDKR